MATRVSAYLYGDVLVLAAWIALRPEDLDSGIRAGRRRSSTALRHELRNAVPSASATSIDVTVVRPAVLGG